jgi:hypothetical protein
MSIVTQRRPDRGLIGALLAVVILAVFVAPAVLFGEGLSAPSLVFASFGVLAAGMLMRGGMGASRSLGTVLVAAGALGVALASGLVVLLLAGWGRGY